MERHYHSPRKQTTKPSKILMLLALLITLILPYLLVKTFSNKQQITPIDKPIQLPQITPKKRPSSPESEWTTITTREGDSLSSLFKRAGLNAQTLSLVLKNNDISTIKPNQTVQLLLKGNTLQKMVLPISTNESIEFYQENNTYKSKRNTRTIETHEHYLTATVHNSLYSTAKRLKIPFNLIAQMAEIFGWEIDFSKDIREDDRFTIIYKAHYVENQAVGAGDIVAVTLTNRGKVYQAIRHDTPSGGHDYYTPEGKSLKKAFNRYPIKFSHISSMFRLSRYHPVLHTIRAHKGVDLAAQIGTPILATGDGHITTITHSESYGNMIKIKHLHDYTTIYAHLLRFQKGLTRGSRITKGQVIGYVGQSGLATGPHLHYEFHQHDVPKNPTTVDLPRGNALAKSERDAFRMYASTMLAHLQLYEQANVVAAGAKTNVDVG